MTILYQNLIEIAQLLGDGQYHDEASIGEQLNITRAAIDEALKKLQQYAVPIIFTESQGYRLEKPLMLLDKRQIQAHLDTQSVDINILEKTDSTNHFLSKTHHENKTVSVCVAETQTQGKGRLGRPWHSPFGQNIYLSLSYPFQKDIGELAGLSLVSGLATCHAIESASDLKGHALSLKWPNDILLAHSKLAGILIEMQKESNDNYQAIIGIGINVNMNSAADREIDQAWTSVLNITDEYQDRNILCATLINTLIQYLNKFSSTGLTGFMDEWNKRDALRNQPISIHSGKNKYHGTYRGINEQGHLLLETPTAELISLTSGDATLLKHTQHVLGQK